MMKEQEPIIGDPALAAKLNCPLQASPHEATFIGPFFRGATFAQCRVKNTSNVRLLVNIKMTNPDFISSHPRCFFLEAGQHLPVTFQHGPFIVSPDSDYQLHQIGFFYLEADSKLAGSPRECKDSLKSSGFHWEASRMKINLQFTSDDYEEADRLASRLENMDNAIQTGQQVPVAASS